MQIVNYFFRQIRIWGKAAFRFRGPASQCEQGIPVPGGTNGLSP